MKRALYAVAVAVLAVLGVGLVMPSPALANANPLPDPIRILPSTAKASIYHLPKLERSMAAAYLMTKTILGSVARKNERAAFQAITAGVATPGQMLTASTVGQKFKPPSLKVKSLLKGAGTAAVAMFGQDILIGLGHAGLEVLGVDVEGNVCGTRNDFVSFLASVDCTDWQMTQEAIAQANADINAGLVLPRLCTTAEGGVYCAEILSVHYGVGGNAATVVCLGLDIDGVPRTGSTATAVMRVAWDFGDGVPTFVTITYPKVTNQFGGSRRLACGPESPGLYAEQVVDGGVAAPLGLMESMFTGTEWVPVGEVDPIESVVADPERRIRCEVELVGGGEVLKAWSAPFRESEGEAPAPVCPQLPPEAEVERITLWLEGGGQDHQLYDESITPEFDTYQTQFPQCLNGSCILDLRKVGLDTCFASNVDCADWFTDPNKEDDYECFYGGTEVGTGGTKVALSECTVYAPLFKPDAGTTASPYGDPETGDPLVGGPGTFPEDVLDPTQPRECFPTGWGVLNPVEWVQKPVQCAIQWAFVPRPSVIQAAAERHAQAWDEFPTSKIAAYIGELQNEMPELEGCEGPRVNFTIDFSTFNDGWVLAYDDYPISACDPPMDWVASMARLLGAFAMYVTATRAIARHLSETIGYTANFGGGA